MLSYLNIRGRRPLYSLDSELDGRQSRCGSGGEEKISCPCWEYGFTFSDDQPVARRYKQSDIINTVTNGK
jgi:hypothetical protein